MKNHYIFLFIILLLSACREEEVIIEEPVITIEEPTEIDGAFLSGQIVDNDGTAVPEAVIEFYQNGNLVGETLTDQNGLYNTVDLPLLGGSQITIAIEEELFAAKYKRTTLDVAETKEIDLRLIRKSGEIIGEDRVLENPGDPDLIKLYGTFTDINDEPIKNAHVLLAWEFERVEDRLLFEGAYDLTDLDGYIELLVPAGEVIYFFSIPSFETAETGCLDFINAEQENILDFGIYFENLGIISSEQEIIEQDDINFSATEYEFTGDFQNCDGSPVSSAMGTMTISYPIGSDTIRRNIETTEFGPNGEYSFDVSICDYSGPLDIELHLTNQDTFGANLIVKDTPTGGTTLGTIQACDDERIRLLSSELNINIGSDYSFAIDFESGVPEDPSSFTLVGTHDDINIGFIIFKMNDIVIGDNLVSELHVGWPFMNEPFSFFSFDEVTASVTQFSNGEIVGTLTGDVETKDLGTQEVTGDFIVRYE